MYHASASPFVFYLFFIFQSQNFRKHLNDNLVGAGFDIAHHMQGYLVLTSVHLSRPGLRCVMIDQAGSAGASALRIVSFVVSVNQGSSDPLSLSLVPSLL